MKGSSTPTTDPRAKQKTANPNANNPSTTSYVRPGLSQQAPPGGRPQSGYRHGGMIVLGKGKGSTPKTRSNVSAPKPITLPSIRSETGETLPAGWNSKDDGNEGRSGGEESKKETSAPPRTWKSIDSEKPPSAVIRKVGDEDFNSWPEQPLSSNKGSEVLGNVGSWADQDDEMDYSTPVKFHRPVSDHSHEKSSLSEAKRKDVRRDIFRQDDSKEAHQISGSSSGSHPVDNTPKENRDVFVAKRKEDQWTPHDDHRVDGGKDERSIFRKEENGEHRYMSGGRDWTAPVSQEDYMRDAAKRAAQRKLEEERKYLEAQEKARRKAIEIDSKFRPTEAPNQNIDVAAKPSHESFDLNSNGSSKGILSDVPDQKIFYPPTRMNRNVPIRGNSVSARGGRLPQQFTESHHYPNLKAPGPSRPVQIMKPPSRSPTSKEDEKLPIVVAPPSLLPTPNESHPEEKIAGEVLRPQNEFHPLHRPGLPVPHVNPNFNRQIYSGHHHHPSPPQAKSYAQNSSSTRNRPHYAPSQVPLDAISVEKKVPPVADSLPPPSTPPNISSPSVPSVAQEESKASSKSESDSIQVSTGTSSDVPSDEGVLLSPTKSSQPNRFPNADRINSRNPRTRQQLPQHSQTQKPRPYPVSQSSQQHPQAKYYHVTPNSRSTFQQRSPVARNQNQASKYPSQIPASSSSSILPNSSSSSHTSLSSSMLSSSSISSSTSSSSSSISPSVTSTSSFSSSSSSVSSSSLLSSPSASTTIASAQFSTSLRPSQGLLADGPEHSFDDNLDAIPKSKFEQNLDSIPKAHFTSQVQKDRPSSQVAFEDKKGDSQLRNLNPETSATSSEKVSPQKLEGPRRQGTRRGRFDSKDSTTTFDGDRGRGTKTHNVGAKTQAKRASQSPASLPVVKTAEKDVLKKDSASLGSDDPKSTVSLDTTDTPKALSEDPTKEHGQKKQADPRSRRNVNSDKQRAPNSRKQQDRSKPRADEVNPKSQTPGGNRAPALSADTSQSSSTDPPTSQRPSKNRQSQFRSKDLKDAENPRSNQRYNNNNRRKNENPEVKTPQAGSVAPIQSDVGGELAPSQVSSQAKPDQPEITTTPKLEEEVLSAAPVKVDDSEKTVGEKSEPLVSKDEASSDSKNEEEFSAEFLQAKSGSLPPTASSHLPKYEGQVLPGVSVASHQVHAEFQEGDFIEYKSRKQKKTRKDEKRKDVRGNPSVDSTNQGMKKNKPAPKEKPDSSKDTGVRSSASQQPQSKLSGAPERVLRAPKTEKYAPGKMTFKQLVTGSKPASIDSKAPEKEPSNSTQISENVVPAQSQAKESVVAPDQPHEISPKSEETQKNDTLETSAVHFKPSAEKEVPSPNQIAQSSESLKSDEKAVQNDGVTLPKEEAPEAVPPPSAPSSLHQGQGHEGKISQVPVESSPGSGVNVAQSPSGQRGPIPRMLVPQPQIEIPQNPDWTQVSQAPWPHRQFIPAMNVRPGGLYGIPPEHDLHYRLPQNPEVIIGPYGQPLIPLDPYAILPKHQPRRVWDPAEGSQPHSSLSEQSAHEGISKDHHVHDVPSDAEVLPPWPAHMEPWGYPGYMPPWAPQSSMMVYPPYQLYNYQGYRPPMNPPSPADYAHPFASIHDPHRIPINPELAGIPSTQENEKRLHDASLRGKDRTVSYQYAPRKRVEAKKPGEGSISNEDLPLDPLQAKQPFADDKTRAARPWPPNSQATPNDQFRFDERMYYDRNRRGSTRGRFDNRHNRPILDSIPLSSVVPSSQPTQSIDVPPQPTEQDKPETREAFVGKEEAPHDASADQKLEDASKVTEASTHPETTQRNPQGQSSRNYHPDWRTRSNPRSHLDAQHAPDGRVHRGAHIPSSSSHRQNWHGRSSVRGGGASSMPRQKGAYPFDSLDDAAGFDLMRNVMYSGERRGLGRGKRAGGSDRGGGARGRGRGSSSNAVPAQKPHDEDGKEVISSHPSESEERSLSHPSPVVSNEECAPSSQHSNVPMEHTNTEP